MSGNVGGRQRLVLDWPRASMLGTAVSVPVLSSCGTASDTKFTSTSTSLDVLVQYILFETSRSRFDKLNLQTDFLVVV